MGDAKDGASSKKGDNWLGWCIDVFFLWTGKGGRTAIFLLFVALVSRIFAEVLPWFVSPLLFLAALGFGVLGVVRGLPYILIAGKGERFEGVVGGMDRKEHGGRESRVVYVRALFVYDIGDKQYTAHTTWAEPRTHKRRFGALEPGNKIPVLVDPKKPDRAFPIAEIPHLGWE